MSKPHSDVAYLCHILDEADFLIHSAKNINLEQLKHDPTLQRAYVRSLEVIGEATKNISIATRERHPHVAWRMMAGMRDRLIHAYFAVDYDIVWDVITQKIPQLHADIQAIRHASDKNPL